jgi:hypothetical protein
MKHASLLIVLTVSVLLFASLGSTAADVGPCAVFPPDNPWNRDIRLDPVHPNSANYISNIMANGGDFVHPDFGSDPTYGIPWVEVDDDTPTSDVAFDYEDESDVGPYPIPDNPPIEGGPDGDGDRHILMVNTESCMLYELFYAFPPDPLDPESTWTAGSGAIFDLNSNALRNDGWTSADAAGLPIFPGLARCDEASADAINHALRFTVNETQAAYVYPATHEASDNEGTNYPPMGLRLRLKANYDISDFDGQALGVVHALQKYGMILADNGSNWYISGEADRDNCWDDENLDQLKDIPGTAFEVVGSDGIGAPSLNFFRPGPPVLTWTNLTGATDYEVQVETTSTFSAPYAYQNFIATNTVTTTALADGKYYWRVRGRNGSGSGSWSATASFTVQATG